MGPLNAKFDLSGLGHSDANDGDRMT